MEDLPTHDTGDEKQYRFVPFAGKTLRFTIKAAHDCHLAFTSEEGESEPMFEVFIGGWEGAHSAIRFNKGDDLVKVDTPDILSADEAREFWVAIDHDEVRVGKGGEYEPFLSAALPEHVEVTHYGYSTGWGAAGSFQFFQEHTHASDDNLEYNFQPLYGDTVTFSVSCDHDAHLGFTMGPEVTPQMYEVFIGAWENQNSAIRKNKDATPVKVDTPDECCSGDLKSYWVNVRGGHIRVGKVGSPDPFMEWADPEPIKVTHVGYCTGWGATGQWKFDI